MVGTQGGCEGPSCLLLAFAPMAFMPCLRTTGLLQVEDFVTLLPT